MTTVAVRRDRQSRDALKVANVIRIGQAELKRSIRARDCGDAAVFVAGLLECPCEVASSLRIGSLLLTIRRIGRGKVHGLLSDAGVRSADRRVREMTDRQRFCLAARLRDYASRRRVA